MLLDNDNLPEILRSRGNAAENESENTVLLFRQCKISCKISCLFVFRI